MSGQPPAITGFQLISLLEKDGWIRGRKAKHGRCLTKKMGSGETRVTFVPETRASLPDGTLSAIIGPKQTGIGKKGMQKVIDKYGLK